MREVGRRLLQRMRNLAIDSPVHQHVSMVDLDAGTRRLWTPLYWSFSFHSKQKYIILFAENFAYTTSDCVIIFVECSSRRCL